MKWFAAFLSAPLLFVPTLLASEVAKWPVPRGPSHELTPYRYDSARWRGVPKEYLEDVSACILYSGSTFLVEADGAIETVSHQIVRMNGRKAIEKLGEFRDITYDPTFQTVTLNEARVHKAAGAMVSIEPAHVQVRDLGTEELVYTHEKQVVISFPDIEVGDAIEVKWTTRGKNPEHQGQFFTRYTFGDSQYPVVQDELWVRLPAARSFHYASIGGDVKPEIRENGSRRIYHWRVTNRREPPQDDNLPSAEELRLEVVCSTFPSWEAVGQWQRRIENDCRECTPELARISAEVTRGLTAPADKARALTAWVRRHIRYVSAGQKHDFTPHAPAKVLAARFGDCKDQSQLLAVMLRHAGLTASRAILGMRGDGQVIASVPSPLASHSILIVSIDGKDHWIDTTITAAPWDFLPREDRDRLAYVLNDRSIPLLRTPVLTADDSRIEQTTVLSIGADGSSRGRRTCTYSGLAACQKRDDWLEVPPGERRRMVANDLQNAHSRARLRRLTVDEDRLKAFEKPVVARLDVEIPGHFYGDSQRDGTLTDQVIWSRLLAINLDYDRQAPLELGVPFESIHLYSLTVHPALRIDTVPPEVEITSRWGSYRVRVHDHTARSLVVEIHTRIDAVRVAPADLEAFRQFQESVTRDYPVWITLRPTPELADAATLEAWLALAPADRAAALVLAELYQQHARPADAARVLRQARVYHPADAAVWELTAQVAQETDDESVFGEVLQRFPEESRYALALGESRIRRGNYAGARTVLELIVRKGSESVRGPAHYQLARTYVLEQRPAEALRHLEAAEQSSPETLTSGAALLLKGQLLEQAGRSEDAAAAYRRALVLDASARQPLRRLVELALAAKHPSEALGYLRRFTVAVGDDGPGLLEAAALHLRMNRFEDARDLASRATRTQPSAERDRLLGLVCFHQGDYRCAIDHLSRAAPDAEGITALLRSALMEGQLSLAERQLDRADRVAHPSPEMVKQYALTIALVQRRTEVVAQLPGRRRNGKAAIQAVDAFVCAEQLVHDNPAATQIGPLLDRTFAAGIEIGPAYALRGLVALEHGRLSAAVADAEHCLQLAPREARAYYVRGRVRLERNHEGAVADLRQAVALSRATDPEILHWLAVSLTQSGQPREARQLEERAARLRPDGHPSTEHSCRPEEIGERAKVRR